MFAVDLRYSMFVLVKPKTRRKTSCATKITVSESLDESDEEYSPLYNGTVVKLKQ